MNFVIWLIDFKEKHPDPDPVDLKKEKVKKVEDKSYKGTVLSYPAKKIILQIRRDCKWNRI
jgi:hypothetical protein